MSFNRRENQFLRERFAFPFAHGELTADTTLQVFKAPRRCVVEKIEYVNETGLVADNTNAFKLSMLNAGDDALGTTVVALVFNTDGNDDPVGASIAAATITDAVTPGTEAERTLEAGEVLVAVFDEDGTATLPPGTIIVHLLYL